MLAYTFHGMDIAHLVIWFFIYAFLGWCMECVVIRIQLNHWENRGFARLPFCVIYGFGVFFAMNLFAPLEGNYPALYVAGALGATSLEYLTAQIMIKMFGEVWWNYEHLPFNYKGILCLQSTLGWGLLALIIFGFLNGVIEKSVMRIDYRGACVLATVLVVTYICDFTYNFSKTLIMKKRGIEVESDKQIARLKRKQ